MKKVFNMQLVLAIVVTVLFGFAVSAAEAATKTYDMVCSNQGDSISLVVEWDDRSNIATGVNVDTNGMVRLGQPRMGKAVDIELFSNNDEFVYRMDVKGEGVFKYILSWSSGNIYLQQGDSRFTPEVVGRWSCKTK